MLNRVIIGPTMRGTATPKIKVDYYFTTASILEAAPAKGFFPSPPFRFVEKIEKKSKCFEEMTPCLRGPLSLLSLSLCLCTAHHHGGLNSTQSTVSVRVESLTPFIVTQLSIQLVVAPMNFTTVP